MKKLFIISSKSGKRNYKEIEKELLLNYKREEIKVTKNKRDAKKFAEEFKKSGGEVLILCGGDGALSEVASVLAGSQTALGLIPQGTANDFSKNFNYKNFSISNMEIEKIEDIDLIEVNNEMCINITSLGFDTNVLVYTYDFMKKNNVGATIGYIYGVLKSIFNLENTELKINAVNMSGEKINIEGKFLISALCNGSYYGNGFNPSPNGKINDGILNLILGEEMGILKIFKLLLSYKNGRHIGKKGIYEILTKEGKLESKKEFIYNVDGEIRKSNIIKYKILPKKLKWVYFKGCRK